MSGLRLTVVLLFFGAFLSYVALGVYIIRKNPGALTNRLCAVTIGSFAIWALAEAVISGIDSFNGAQLWMNIGAIGWCSFPVTALWFYLVMTGHEKVARNPIAVLAGIVAIAFFICEQWTGHLISDLVPSSYGWAQVWSAGLITAMYYFYYIAAVFACIYLTVQYGRGTASRRKKRQAKLLLITPLVCMAIGSVTDVVLPALGIDLIPSLAVVAILIWAAALVRAITRHGLMTLTPAVAAENILSTMSDMLVLVNPEGQIAQANKTASTMLGYQEEELRGKQFASFISSLETDTDVPFIELLKEGAVRDQEVTLRTKGNGVIPVLFSGTVLKDEGDEPVGLVAIAHDMTNYHKVQEDLRESEQKYRSLVAHALVGIGIHQDNKLVFANTELARILGYGSEECIGMPIAEIVHPDDREVVMRRAQHRQLGG